MHIKMTKCWEIPCKGLASHPRLSSNSGRFCRPLHATHGCSQDILRGTYNFRKGNRKKKDQVIEDKIVLKKGFEREIKISSR